MVCCLNWIVLCSLCVVSSLMLRVFCMLCDVTVVYMYECFYVEMYCIYLCYIGGVCHCRNN